MAPRTPRRRLVVDRLARWAVTAGGLAIIASILGILVFVVLEVAPLLGGARVSAGRQIVLAGKTPAAVIVDDYRSRAVTLEASGRLSVVDLATGEARLERTLPASDLRNVSAAPGLPLLVAGTADGRIVLQPVGWVVTFDAGGRRVVDARLPEPIVVEADPTRRPAVAVAAAVDDGGTATAVAATADGRLVVLRRTVERNPITDEVAEAWSRHETPAPVALSRVLIDETQRDVYGASAAAELVVWRLDEDGRPAAPEVLEAGSPVTALTLSIGGRSLLVGHFDGSVSVWFPVARGGERPRLTRIRELRALRAPVLALAPSQRDRSFAAADQDGGLALLHSTSERVLWTGRSPLGAPSALVFAPKADALWLAAPGRAAELEVDNPHPEVSLAALFGRVWYEGYPGPRFVWQSTGGTDDFEPKLSLTPLALGTLKGTLYSLILAVPLGVLGAMYASQFMHHDLRRYLKPTVEIMAALPSVVLGFLAGLWLAPRLERSMPALGLMLVALPLAMVAAGALWRHAPLGLRHRWPAGSETLLQLVAVTAGAAACLALGPRVEVLLFDGSFPAWLLDTTGLALDQRNALVVGIAMGFAVIPIIFSISEDAFSNVPSSLVSASLALGANRWQTVTRVVLPTASPGIFSAIMIGFGRAVGETMIVLMATGNTPILDWSPFNGFRTLSANIAVEIPEAPLGGTLYRTLFLAALLLFVFTFATNTAADLVRQRLRRRYAQR